MQNNLAVSFLGFLFASCILELELKKLATTKCQQTHTKKTPTKPTFSSLVTRKRSKHGKMKTLGKYLFYYSQTPQEKISDTIPPHTHTSKDQ